MKRIALPAWLLTVALAWAWGARSSRSALTGPEPDPAPRFERQELTNLWGIAGWQDRIAWQPFRPGVEVHRLYGDGQTGPNAVLLRYKEAARVPVHIHGGYEHVLVLAGSQRDQNGTLQAGTLAIHPPGTAHGVVSDAGCIVLVIYEKPVRFPEPSRAPQP